MWRIGEKCHCTEENKKREGCTVIELTCVNNSVIVHLSITVVDKDVPCAVVFQVGDLQATGVADLGRLEGGIEGFNFHHCLGIPGLDGGRHKQLLVHCKSPIFLSILGFHQSDILPL